MSARSVLILLAICVALIVVYVAVKPARYTEPEKITTFEELVEKLDLASLGEIHLKAQSEGEPVETLLKKHHNVWVLPSLYNYPAKAKDVDDLLLSLLKIGEARLVADNPESHPDYEVGAEKGKQLLVKGLDEQEICSLVIGKSDSDDWKRCYVRLDDSHLVYSVRPNLSSKLKAWNLKQWATNWLDKTLIDLDEDKGEEVVQIDVERRDGKNFSLKKVTEEKPVPQGSPPSEERATQEQKGGEAKAPQEEGKNDAAAKKEGKDSDGKGSSREGDGESEKKTGKKETAKEEKPKTIKETKWYVITKEGRKEADTSSRSSFVTAVSSVYAKDSVKPPEKPAEYGLDPAYLKITIRTEYTKDPYKEEKVKPYVLLIGDRVPEKPASKKKPETKEPEKTAKTAPPQSTSAKVVEHKEKAEKSPEPLKKTEKNEPKKKANGDPPQEGAGNGEEKPQSSKAQESKKKEEPKAPAGNKKEASQSTPEAPKLTTDRYAHLQGDPRFMTLAEWKIKSLDKKPEDLLPKKEEKKKEEKPAQKPKKEAVIGPPPPPKKTGPQKKTQKEKKTQQPEKEAASGAAENTSRRLTARHILIAYKGSGVPGVERTKEQARAKAEELLAKLKKNPDSFAQLAKQFSDDAASKLKGGLMENFDPNDMVAPFRKAVLKLAPGELSGIVETRYGFHIIQVPKGP